MNCQSYLEDDSVRALADLLDLDEVVEAHRFLAVHVAAAAGGRKEGRS